METNKKCYIINVSGEDGGCAEVMLTNEAYEEIKSAFEVINSRSNYVSATIDEVKPRHMVYAIEVSRTGRPRNIRSYSVSGYYIEEGQTPEECLRKCYPASYVDGLMFFNSREEAYEYYDKFKK